jgi:hypothetical protein
MRDYACPPPPPIPDPDDGESCGQCFPDDLPSAESDSASDQEGGA